MPKTVCAMLLLTAALAATAGCQKLDYSKTFTLGPRSLEDIHFGAPAYNQRVTVTISPVSAGVSAYLVKEADWEKAFRALRQNTEPNAALVLASRVSQGAPEEYTLEATVPAKTEYALLLRGGGKTTDVKVTVTGR